MVEYAVMIGSIGALIFSLIREIFAAITGNTTLFAFICVAVFGVSLTLATEFLITVIQSITGGLNARALRQEEFDIFMADIRQNKKDMFDLDEAQREMEEAENK